MILILAPRENSLYNQFKGERGGKHVGQSETQTQTKVVIADDDPFIRMNLREMLAGLNYAVVGEAQRRRDSY